MFKVKTVCVPVVIFCYNRLWHLEQTISALRQNTIATQTQLIIYADAPKSEAKNDTKNGTNKQKTLFIKAYLQTLQYSTDFLSVEIIFRETNFGLAKSIIEGATEVLEKYGKAIFLEDDLVSSPDFLQYMNDALAFYENNDKIFSISGYNPPIEIPKHFLKKSTYLCPRACSWGWATWLHKWQKNDWQVLDFEIFIKDKKAQKRFHLGGNDMTVMLLKQQKKINNSWAIRWAYTHFKYNVFCLYPIKTKIHNIGNDGAGTHAPKTKKYSHKAPLSTNAYVFEQNPTPDNEMISTFARFYNLSIIRKIINWFTFGI